MNSFLKLIVAIVLSAVSVSAWADPTLKPINFSTINESLTEWIKFFERKLIEDDTLREQIGIRDASKVQLDVLVQKLNATDRNDKSKVGIEAFNRSLKIQNLLLERFETNLADMEKQVLAMRWLEIIVNIEPLSPHVRSRMIDTSMQILNSGDLKLQLAALKILVQMAKTSVTTLGPQQLRILDGIQAAIYANLLKDEIVQQKALLLVAGMVPAVDQFAKRAVVIKRLQVLFLMIHPGPEVAQSEKLSINAMKALDDLIVRSDSVVAQKEVLRLYNAISHRIYNDEFKTQRMDYQIVQHETPMHKPFVFEYDHAFAPLDRSKGALSSETKAKISGQMIRALSKLAPVNGEIALEKAVALAQAVRLAPYVESQSAARFLRLELIALGESMNASLSTAEEYEALGLKSGYLVFLANLTDRYQRDVMLTLTDGHWPSSGQSMGDKLTDFQVLELLTLLKPRSWLMAEMQARLISKGLTSNAFLVRRSTAEKLVQLASENTTNANLLMQQATASLKNVDSFALSGADSDSESLTLLLNYAIDSKELSQAVRSALFLQIVRLGSPAHKQEVQKFLAEQVLSGEIDCNAILKKQIR